MTYQSYNVHNARHTQNGRGTKLKHNLSSMRDDITIYMYTKPSRAIFVMTWRSQKPEKRLDNATTEREITKAIGQTVSRNLCSRPC